MADAESDDFPKHHYIPVLYLSKWSDQGRLIEFSRPPGRARVEARPTGPKGTGYQRGLYRLSGLPEEIAEAAERKFMGQVDNLAKDALDVLLVGGRYTWTVKKRSAWSRFVNGMLFRVPERVLSARRFIEDFWLEGYESREQRYNREKTETDPDFVDFVVQAAERASIEYTMGQIDDPRIGAHLNRMIWGTIDVSSVGRAFFTSDRPVIRTNGLAFKNSHLAMPIGPTKLFIATNTDEEANKLRAINKRELVKSVNRHVVRRAQRFAWNTGSADIEFVRKHLSADAHLDEAQFAVPPNRPPQQSEAA